MKMQQLNTSATWARARKMTNAALRFSARDAIQAAKAADELERAGNRVTKSEGYYRDEATVYASELRRRGVAVEYDSLHALADPISGEGAMSFLVFGEKVEVVESSHPDLPETETVMSVEEARETYRRAIKAGWVVA